MNTPQITSILATHEIVEITTEDFATYDSGSYKFNWDHVNGTLTLVPLPSKVKAGGVKDPTTGKIYIQPISYHGIVRVQFIVSQAEYDTM